MQRILWLSPEGECREAFDQCEAFKRTLWSAIGPNPDDAFLKTVHHNGHRGIAVEYDSGVPCAVAFAERAEREAARAGDAVLHNLRVVARSRGA